jgi:hypothetical protein
MPEIELLLQVKKMLINDPHRTGLKGVEVSALLRCTRC